MTRCDYGVPLGVECAWPGSATRGMPKAPAWAAVAAFLRRFFG